MKLILKNLFFLPFIAMSSEDDCFLCIFTFVLVYYFSMVGAIWFVILAYSWSICFKSLGSRSDNFAGKVVYFHAIAWSFPLTWTVSILALQQVQSVRLTIKIAIFSLPFNP